VRPVGSRRIRLFVADSTTNRHALKLASVNHARISRRVLLCKLAFEYVGDDLCFLKGMKCGDFPWRKMYFVESGKDSEVIDGLARIIPGVECKQNFLLALLDTASLRIPAQRDHESTPPVSTVSVHRRSSSRSAFIPSPQHLLPQVRWASRANATRPWQLLSITLMEH
jgi:hypothetical protein